MLTIYIQGVLQHTHPHREKCILDANWWIHQLALTWLNHSRRYPSPDLQLWFNHVSAWIPSVSSWHTYSSYTHTLLSFRKDSRPHPSHSNTTYDIWIQDPLCWSWSTLFKVSRIKNQESFIFSNFLPVLQVAQNGLPKITYCLDLHI